MQKMFRYGLLVVIVLSVSSRLQVYFPKCFLFGERIKIKERNANQ